MVSRVLTINNYYDIINLGFFADSHFRDKTQTKILNVDGEKYDK